MRRVIGIGPVGTGNRVTVDAHPTFGVIVHADVEPLLTLSLRLDEAGARAVGAALVDAAAALEGPGKGKG